MQFSTSLIAALATGAIAYPGGLGSLTDLLKPLTGAGLPIKRDFGYGGEKKPATTTCSDKFAKQTPAPIHEAPPAKATHPAKQPSPEEKNGYPAPPPKETPYKPSHEDKNGYPALTTTLSTHYSKPTPAVDPVEGYPREEKKVDPAESLPRKEEYVDPAEGHPLEEEKAKPAEGHPLEEEKPKPAEGHPLEEEKPKPAEGHPLEEEKAKPAPHKEEHAPPVDANIQSDQCGNGNAVSCCNTQSSGSGLLELVLGGSCSLQIPIIGAALGSSCNAGNTFCCPTSQEGDINIALPCIPINL